MVWGCIMHGQKGPLIILDYPGGRGGGMSAVRYRDQVLELEPAVHPFYEQVVSERGQVWFQQDNASIHTAYDTRKWLQDNNVLQFPHPSKSPDFSPIEPVWHDLKNHIRASPDEIRSDTDLKLRIRQAWNALTILQIDAHINRLPKTLDACIRNRGGTTRY